MKISSKVLNEDREILVLPLAGYKKIQARYPVLYLLDGESRFFQAAAVVDSLSNSGHIPEMLIVIALISSPRHHYRDFSPTAVDYLPASGGAGAFLRFLQDELVIFVDAQYRTLPYRIPSGHGLSGLFAVYVLLEAADV